MRVVIEIQSGCVYQVRADEEVEVIVIDRDAGTVGQTDFQVGGVDQLLKEDDEEDIPFILEKGVKVDKT